MTCFCVCVRLCAPHPSSGFRETPDATFPQGGRLAHRSKLITVPSPPGASGRLLLNVSEVYEIDEKGIANHRHGDSWAAAHFGGLFWIWPIYPDERKQVASVSELREMLGEYEATKDYVVIDPANFGMKTESVYLDVTGRTRDSDPDGYLIKSVDAEEARFDALIISAGDRYSPYRFEGTAYRNTEVMLTTETYPSGERGVKLTLKRGRCYYIWVSYSPAGLSEKEITQRDAELQELLCAVADRIIDGAG